MEGSAASAISDAEMCIYIYWKKLFTRDSPIWSEVGLGWEFTRNPEQFQLTPTRYITCPLSLYPPSCLFIYPLKADQSRLHDQAKWILSSVPLPRQCVYGMLCQRVTSTHCSSLLLCCRSKAEPIKRTPKKKKIYRWRCTQDCPLLSLCFEEAPQLKEVKERGD